jgi:uncharacterized protein
MASPRSFLNVVRAVETGREGITRRVALQTEGGVIQSRVHEDAPGDTAVLWVFGAGGGFDGPAGGVYPRLSKQLAPMGIAGMELAYRYPARLAPCVQDVLAAVEWLTRGGRNRIILVGHSFGGAVVITAGAIAPEVIGVVALSPQLYGAGAVDAIAPRPVALIHGEADEVLPDTCSRELYRLAREPKQLTLYPGCGHGLDECQDALDRDLMAWLSRVARKTPRGADSASAT